VNGRIMTPFERALTTTVNDIEHIEGVSYAGFGVSRYSSSRPRHPHG